jgi:hypothetical protein
MFGETMKPIASSYALRECPSQLGVRYCVFRGSQRDRIAILFQILGFIA